MNKDITVLREAVVKLTQMLADMGLTVTQRGTQAYVRTDAKTLRPKIINIPFIPDNADESLILAIQGFIDHEVAHVLFTDWSVVKKATKKGPNLAQLHNLFEDTFIERAIGKKFPGSLHNLDRLHKFFVDRISRPAYERVKGDVEQEFGVLMVCVARAWSGQKQFQHFLDSIDGWSNPLIKTLLDKIPPNLVSRVPKLKSSQDAFAVAEIVHDILFPPKPKEAPSSARHDAASPPPPAESEEDDDQDGEGGKGAGKDEGEEEKETEEKGESEKDDPEDSDEDDKDDSQSDGDEDGGSASDDSDDETSDEDDGTGPPETDSSEDDRSDEGSDAEGDSEDESSSDDQDSGTDGKDEVDDEDKIDGEDDQPESGSGDEESSEEDDAEEEDSSSDASGEEGADADEAEGASSDAGDGDEENGSKDAGDGSADGDADPAAPADEDEVEDDTPSTEQPKSTDFESADVNLNHSDFEGELARVITDATDREARSADYLVYTTDFDQIVPHEISGDYRDEWLAQLDDKTRHMIGPMQKNVERMMAARSQVIKVPGFRSGRLHSGSLHRLSAGDDRVFRKVQENKSVETAVTLLIDNSGSMRHSGAMRLAMCAGYALSQTLERVKIKHEVLGFTTKTIPRNGPGSLREQTNEAHRIGRPYSRFEPMYMPIYKGFEERVGSDVKRRFASSYGDANFARSNIDGEAVQVATRRLMTRPERRKVLIVMSDGFPAGSPGVGRELYSSLHGAVADAEKQRVEVIGIGIMSKAVETFYPRHIVLDKLENLPGGVINELRRILLS